jgi:predicted RND superfamily exporter protein
VNRYVRSLERHAWAIAVAGCALFVAAIAVAVHLELRADLAELLPDRDPALGHLRAIDRRVGAPTTLIVAVEGPDPGANRRFAEALAAQLRPLVAAGQLRAIDYRSDEHRGFFERWRALYAPLADLERVLADVEALLLQAKSPAFVALDDPRADLDALAARAANASRSARGTDSGYFEGEGGHLLALVAWAASSGSGDADGFAIRDRVARAVAAAGPERYGVSARLTGDVVVAIAEHDALKQDIELVSGLCALLVLGVIIAWFRSAWAIPYIFFPTLLGVATAFAITTFTIGYLNTNTAFLGSIILGNGINFGIILLGRYEEERRAGLTVEEALARALGETARPTLGAALAAAVAYGSLGVTRFRGFQHFGFVGGVGMILCWLFTFSYGPALIFATARWRRRERARRASGALVRAGRFVLGRPAPLLVAGATLSLVALAALAPVARDPFEHDFRKLRNQRSERGGAGELFSRVGKLFPGDNVSPIAVALTDTVEDAAQYRRALLLRDCARAGNSEGECVRRVDSGAATGGILDDVQIAESRLPDHQPEKLELLARLARRLDDPALRALSDEDRARVDDWRARVRDLRPLTVADLPEPLARPFRERDGTVGRVALIYPVKRFQGWDGRQLLALDELVREVRLPGGAVVEAAGLASVFAAMLRAIVPDGTRAAVVSFAGVALLVIAVVRRARGISLVLSSLAAGALWMAGAGASLGLKLNFLNFVALPVTFGIGVDYALNIAARVGAAPVGDRARALVETGSAVALCSCTTIIGYGSLLIADNGALRSFGMLAGLGEVGCLTAALLVLPALVGDQASAS